MFARLMKETQPLRFFGAFSALFLAASLVLMTPVLIEFFQTGLVPRMPTWVLSVGLLLLSMLMAVTGLILDSVSRGRAEQKRIFYLSMPSARDNARNVVAAPTPATGTPVGRGKPHKAA
jgi:hypothetical protein